MKKYDSCPIREKNGILIKRKIIRIPELNPLERSLLAYIENWDRGCVNDIDYLAFVFNVPVNTITLTLDILVNKDLVYVKNYGKEPKIFCNINLINDVYGEGIEL
jgi:hypothetical protein